MLGALQKLGPWGCLAVVSLVTSVFSPLTLAAEERRELTVVTSIKPLHSLVAGVMQGADEPHLLLQGRSNPHSFQLRPSAARLIRKADLVIWVGPMLEAPLSRSLNNLGEKGRLLAMVEVPGMQLLARRNNDEGHGWHNHGPKTAADKETHAAHQEEKQKNEPSHKQLRFPLDPHLWLSPDNAVIFVEAVAARLAELDPARAPLYRNNAEKIRQRLGNLRKKISQQLSPLKGRSYMVFHDAYQYLTAPYDLDFAGAVTLDPAVPARAGHLTGLRTRLKDGGIACVFAEPQFNQRIVKTLVDGTGVKIATLDPLGSAIKAGPEAYEALLLGLAREMHGCLALDQ